MLRLALALALPAHPALAFGVTSVDDTTTTPTTTTTTTTSTTKGTDGSAPNLVIPCFNGGGDCALCCGGCVETTTLDNQATTDSCVCYKADTKPSGRFDGTKNNDCVFIKADDVTSVYVRNQCLEGAEEVLAPGAAKRKLILGTR